MFLRLYHEVVQSKGALHRLLINIQHSTSNISKKRVRDRFTYLTERNLENGNIYEVIWLMYALRGLKTPINSLKISELAEENSSSALALIMLDMKDKGLFVRKLPVNEWESKITIENIYTGPHWLLGYEGIRHG